MDDGFALLGSALFFCGTLGEVGSASKSRWILSSFIDVALGLLGPNACIGYTSPATKPATTAIGANTQNPNRPLARFVGGNCAAKSKLVFESMFN
jgi:hypothetical protein